MSLTTATTNEVWTAATRTLRAGTPAGGTRTYLQAIADAVWAAAVRTLFTTAIAGLTVTAMGATWTAFAGTDHYQISINGGAFSITGISGTTYTGTILPGQTVIVQALDGNGIVVAQASAIYTRAGLVPAQAIGLSIL